MRILILGCGFMGPAAARNALADPEVKGVTLADREQCQVDSSAESLENAFGAQKLALDVFDVVDETAAAERMKAYDVVISALPRRVSPAAIAASGLAGKPLVDLTRPTDEDLAVLKHRVAKAGNLLILGCGVDPGLSEIMAVHLAERFERLEELHIKCGGIPLKPKPPLGYKIVFGGRELPLREEVALVAEHGHLKPVPRYSGIELTSFAGVGTVEAYHEGFVPWLLDQPALQELRAGTQKTLRWPGYAAKAEILKEVGLLSSKAVEVDGAQVVPKRLLDTLLGHAVRLEKGEEDLTLFRVEAKGTRAGLPLYLKVEMVDRYDPRTGLTSMSRTTAFTASIIARMVGRGEITGEGLQTPEKLIRGAAFRQLVKELAAAGILFHETVETTTTL